MLHIRVSQQILEQIERRAIQPLQIVKKQRERVLLAREYTEEASEHHLEAVLRVLRWQVRNRRLRADDKLELRHEVHYQLAVRAQRLA